MARFAPALALDPATGLVVPNAQATIYAIGDVNFTTPLAITDGHGIALSALVASPNGIYPEFQTVNDATEVVARSGQHVTPLYARNAFSSLPESDTFAIGEAYGVTPASDGRWTPVAISSESGGGTGGGSVRRVLVTTGQEARPAGAELVIWMGPVEPVNMADYDVWFPTEGAPTQTPPSFVTASLNAMAVGSPFAQTLVVNGSPPMTYQVTGGLLPAGLQLNQSTGAITGTPTTSGNYSFTIGVSNAVGQATRAFTGSVSATVLAPTAVSTVAINPMTVGQTFSQALTANGTAPLTWDRPSGTLPPGINLSSSGVLSGVPTQAGNYTFTVRASNSAGSAQKQFSITVAPSSNPGGGARHSVFGSGGPTGTYTLYDDLGVGGRTAVQFYTYGSPSYSGWQIVGARFWVPLSYAGPAIGQDITFHVQQLAEGQIGGASTPAADRLAGILTGQSKVKTNLQPGWNAVDLDTPIPMFHATGLWVAAQVGDGRYYVHTPNIPEGAVTASDGTRLALAANIPAEVRNLNSLNGGSYAALGGGFYGLDIIIREP